MVKHLLVGSAVAAAMMIASTGAFAHNRHNSSNLNVGVVADNSVSASSNTGGNMQVAGQSGRGTQTQTMTTGDSVAAAGQVNAVNNNGCGCDSNSSRHASNTNVGVVYGNDVSASSNTGMNDQVALQGSSRHRGGIQTQTMTTGNSAAFAGQWNVVNN